MGYTPVISCIVDASTRVLMHPWAWITEREFDDLRQKCVVKEDSNTWNEALPPLEPARAGTSYVASPDNGCDFQDRSAYLKQKNWIPEELPRSGGSIVSAQLSG